MAIDVQTEAELMALGVMAFVIALKTVGFYLMKKRSDPEITRMAPQYIITAILALLIAYSAYTVQSNDIFEVFRSAAKDAITYNLLLDVPSKFAKD